MGKSKTTEQFISEAKAVHGDKYDYSKVKYNGAYTKVCIICPKHGDFWQLPFSHNSGAGCPQCYHTLHKVGTYDLPNNTQYAAVRNKWKLMLSRCYYQKHIAVRPSYGECSVCDEWLTFSNFKKWFEDPKNGYQEGYHLDKDILVKGNKLYSPDTCCFVPQEINALFHAHIRSKNLTPVGVRKRRERYEANIFLCGKQKFLGTFNTPEKAFQAYKSAKEHFIKELAEKYFQEGKITKKVYDALMKYDVEITD